MSLYVNLLVLIATNTAVIGIPLINMVSNQILKVAERQTNQTLELLEYSINRTLGRIYRLSDQLTAHVRLGEFLAQGNIDNAVDRDLEIYLQGRFQELVQIYEDVVAIFVFSHGTGRDDGFRSVSSYSSIAFNEEKPIREEQWYTKAIASDGNIVITPIHLQNFIKRNYRWVLSASRQIHNNSNSEIIGVLLIDFNIEIIKDICVENSTETHYYYLLDEMGKILFHPHEELINSGLLTEPTGKISEGEVQEFKLRIDGQKKMYRIRQDPYSGWKIIAVTKVRELYAPFLPSITFLLIWLSLVIVLLLVVTRRISSRVLDPIQRLRESMKKVEDGYFDISVEVPEYDEVGAMARDYNIMIRKIGDLIRLNEEEQKKLRFSDFRALQSQINPHFLYNTLDSVIWMTAKDRKDDVILMISSLSKLLRRSLATGNSLITLEEEYEHARQYCIIQKIRYQDQLDYSLELPEDCKSFIVPRLILQPIIENALYHGIEDWDDGGDIRVTSKNCGTFLEIVVSDNGVGTQISLLEKNLEEDESTKERNSIGLKNINDRLKILFGADAGLSFRSSMHQGLDVILRVPLNVKPSIFSSLKRNF
ncbi:MAG: sensor histidine kinase [Spirochaetaceae bacterium]|nr:sensor histidine kinase [Spirochaetaceae bacterium]